MNKPDRQQPPLISVIMAVWKPHPVYFRQAVDSILAQTMPDFELLIIEKHSDTSAHSLLPGDTRIRWMEMPNDTELAAQRNAGLMLAGAEWVAVMDADDIAEPERLAFQLKYIHAHPEVDVLGAQITVIDSEGKEIGRRDLPQTHEDIVKTLSRCNALSHSTVLMRRLAALEAGGYSAAFNAAEDYALWMRLAKQGKRFAACEQSLLRYRIHLGQMKHTHLRDTLRGTLRVRSACRQQARLTDYLRDCLERALLLCPPGLVYRLCVLLRYRK